MTDLIEFRDDQFSFRHNGVLVEVHTEVGNGPARVVVKETFEQEEDAMEQSE